MAGHRRSVDTLQTAIRRVRVQRLTLQGKNQYEIAEELKVDQSTVSRDLEAVRRWYREQAAREKAEEVNEQIAGLELLIAQASAGYERSCRDAETRHAETLSGRTDKKGRALPDQQKKWVTTEGQAGDPRFLQQIREARAEIAKLRGLYPANKHEHSGPEGRPIEHVHELSDDQLAAIAAGGGAGTPAPPTGPPAP